MKISISLFSLLSLASLAPTALAQECTTYEPTDTAEKCYPLFVPDPECWEPDAGTVCISVTGTTMSLTFKTISYWSIFKTRIWLGGSIDDCPRIGDALDLGSFTYIGEDLRGNTEVNVKIDISKVDMDAVACGANGESMVTIVPQAKVGEFCENPEEPPYLNWLEHTDYPATGGDKTMTTTKFPYHYVTMPITCSCAEDKMFSAPTKTGSGSGDPHFKLWTGEKFDYHGECDLVLVDNPSFDNGKGLQVHVRTTRIKYFSYIEKIAVKIGNDVLEFANDVENFLLNGKPAEKNKKHHKTMLGGFIVRRDKKALSIRLTENYQQIGGARIDLKAREIGFPAVVVNDGDSDIFRGSLGLLGDWETGKRLARDGKTELNDDDATAFALEWQVRDTESILFQDVRLPQYPQQCIPPAKMMGNRLGIQHAREEAAKACAHWKEDKEDCIFDVIATRDVMVAAEGSIAM